MRLHSQQHKLRLAEALRANLRRRKAGNPARTPSAPKAEKQATQAAKPADDARRPGS